MYFDPNIYIFEKLIQIEDLLDENFCVITPHHSDLESEWSGAVPENNVLISGKGGGRVAPPPTSYWGRQCFPWVTSPASTRFHPQRQFVFPIDEVIPKGVTGAEAVGRSGGHLLRWQTSQRNSTMLALQP
jgi:hypothetical protein